MKLVEELLDNNNKFTVNASAFSFGQNKLIVLMKII